MFHDEKLKELEKEASENMKAYHDKLNKISSDIKSMEEFFRKSGVMDNFTLQIDDDKFLNFLNDRISYVDYNEIKCNIKPLIEQKVNVRIYCYPYLQMLLEECLDRLKFSVKKIGESICCGN